MWKKGKRQDNREATRNFNNSSGNSIVPVKGVCFFCDDEDYFELGDALQGMCFAEQGMTYVPVKPWVKGSGGGWVADQRFLSVGARAMISKLRVRDDDGDAVVAV